MQAALPLLPSRVDQAAERSSFLRRRRRPKAAKAPAPNSTIIGGSGTWVPEVVLVHL
jgi:hypothetical protein